MPWGDGFVGLSLVLPHRSALAAADPLALAPEQVMNRCVRGVLRACELERRPRVLPGARPRDRRRTDPRHGLLRSGGERRAPLRDGPRRRAGRERPAGAPRPRRPARYRADRHADGGRHDLLRAPARRRPRGRRDRRPDRTRLRGAARPAVRGAVARRRRGVRRGALARGPPPARRSRSPRHDRRTARRPGGPLRARRRPHPRRLPRGRLHRELSHRRRARAAPARLRCGCRRRRGRRAAARRAGELHPRPRPVARIAAALAQELAS
jgi:hypothetical protein